MNLHIISSQIHTSVHIYKITLDSCWNGFSHHVHQIIVIEFHNHRNDKERITKNNLHLFWLASVWYKYFKWNQSRAGFPLLTVCQCSICTHGLTLTQWQSQELSSHHASSETKSWNGLAGIKRSVGLIFSSAGIFPAPRWMLYTFSAWYNKNSQNL